MVRPKNLQKLYELVAQEANVTSGQKGEVLFSGRKHSVNQIRWAVAHLFKAGPIVHPSRSHYQITQVGQGSLKNHSNGIKLSALKQIEGYTDQWNKQKTEYSYQTDAEEQYPHELVERGTEYKNYEVSEEFNKRPSTNPQLNRMIELLRRLLSKVFYTLSNRNVATEQKFSKVLEQALRSYDILSLTAADLIAKLVELAKHIYNWHDRGEKLGLWNNELAIYNSVYQTGSEMMELGDDVLERIALGMADVERANAKMNWGRKWHVREPLRRTIRGLLTKHGYSPENQVATIQLVIQQTKLMAASSTVIKWRTHNGFE
jgi:type I site-specific restriction-modification system R (restriction) subunit